MPRQQPTRLRFVNEDAEAAELLRRFEERRRELIRRLDDPERHSRACVELDRLHVAVRSVRHPPRLRAPSADKPEDERLARMRRLIEISLEDGLLRHSRRQRIIEEGMALGFSSFHTQLMIAQVQAGDHELIGPLGRRADAHETDTRTAPRVAAILLLTFGFFLALVRWSGV